MKSSVEKLIASVLPAFVETPVGTVIVRPAESSEPLDEANHAAVWNCSIARRSGEPQCYDAQISVEIAFLRGAEYCDNEVKQAERLVSAAFSNALPARALRNDFVWCHFVGDDSESAMIDADSGARPQITFNLIFQQL